MSAEETPRRMTVSRMAELLATRPLRGGESSVDITRNAKGLPQFAVSVQHIDPREAMRVAQELYDELERLYPYPTDDSLEAQLRASIEQRT